MNTPSSQPVCAITGGSAGIGLAAAKRFAASGYAIAICGRDLDKLSAARDEILAKQEKAKVECQVTQCDLSTTEGVEGFLTDVVSSWARIDVLVNNAGAATMAPIDEISPQDFERMLTVNLGATFHATQFAWRMMKNAGGGTIINVASQAARDPFPGFSVYGACKAWVTLFTQAIAKEGRAHNIRVYGVLPGAVETTMLRGLLPEFPSEDTLSPEDVAETIFALTQPPWKHASGSLIDVVK